MARADALADTGDVGDRPGHEIDGVVEHFGGESACLGVGEIDLVVLVPLVGPDGELVGAGFAYFRGEGADVESRPHEAVREMIEEPGIARRIARADVVEGLDDAGAEQVAPDAIRVARGEVGIFRTGDPGGELLASAGLFGIGEGHFREGCLVGEVRSLDGSGAVVLDFSFGFVGDDFVEGFGSFHGGAADVLGGRVLGVAGESYPGEVGGGLVVLVLGPLLEGMVVALVAIEPRREEKMGGVLHEFIRFAQDFVVGGGGVLLV